MTINSTDIKLLESERMSDASDGGGRKTSRVIVDGQPGNIFPKVSRLDSVYGRVNLRKVYGAVVTENLDTYAGAHAVVMDPPDNDRIHVNLFSTSSDYDTRTAARDRIESYVVAGPESRMVLYGRQLVGQQAVLIYQRVEEPLPEVGEVYCLSKEAGSVTNYQQFVRVTDITTEVRTFNDGEDFQRLLVTLEIGAPLRYEFRGPDTPSRASNVAREALVRNTTVADAARYYGIRPLSEAADEDALTVRVDSVYSPIVPTTQRESPISLASIGGAGGYVVTAQIDYADGVTSLPNGIYYFKTAIKPGTIRISKGGVLWAEDDAVGNIVSTAAGGAPWNGSIDYESGRVEVIASYMSDFVTFAATPAVVVSQPARTREIEVTLGNRGTVYSEALNPLPNPGSVIVDYRALGKWYRLRDDGTGAVQGNDPAYGAGTVDYVTGALVLTLGALPDVDSSVLISWGSMVDYVIRAGTASDVAAGLRQTFTLESLPIQPASLEITFTSGVTAYTATANGSGVISGNGVTGSVNHTTGVVEITYTTRLPNSGSMVVADYNQQVPSDPGNPIVVSGSIDWHGPDGLTPAPLLAGSFVGTMGLSGGGGMNAVSGTVSVVDNSAGLLVVRAGQLLGSNSYGGPVTVKADTTVGTINYTTGTIAVSDLTEVVTVESARYYSSLGGGTWSKFDQALDIASAAGTYIYTQTGGDPVQTARSDEFSTTDAPLVVDLTATTADAVVPGSVLFTINGSAQTFFDRNGTIYTDLDTSTGAALACGAIDYDTGRVSLTGQWPQGESTVTLAVQACLTVFGDFSTTEAFFRTAGSPLRPGSLYVQASALDGALLSGTADVNGVITGTKVRGEVVQDMGVARVEFGEDVGGTWTPIEVAPSTLRYSAVVLSNLPLNADILGLDPVRLPSDGRVPIYRPADVVVIHHEATLALPNPSVAGATYSMGRAGLSELWLVDADGVRVPTTKYTANLAAGTLTMAADLSLTGYTQPLVAHHRIEEMQLLSDVQINGQLGLTAPLSREFPADSYVSSALLFGDMNARYTNLFDQASWTSVWSDALIGSGATAQYNDIDYPVEVLNNGAVSDRWRINFTTGNPSSGTANFQVISENLGVIATGNTGSDCAPVNGLTGEPYFVIRSGGWGIGWAVGNQVRFNTVAASAPIWIARTVLPGATLGGDAVTVQLRGDVDA